MQANTQTKMLKKRYAEALLSGEQEFAARVIQEGLSQEVTPVRLYLDVITPSLVHVGNLWHQGEVNAAQEHLATEISLRQMDYLLSLLQPAKKLGVRAVVTAVENEHHAIGARMFADFLFMDGWDVDFLGRDTPTRDLVEFVQQRGAGLVALSVTLPESLPYANQSIQELHSLEPSPKVLVGGSALKASPNEANLLGADALISDPLLGLQEARSLLGLNLPRHTLDEYLKIFGERVQSNRRKLKWSQQQLADKASLDRTYISMVEGGKQNLTLGAMMRIADALEVNLDTLLRQDFQ